jgi:dolichyl-diphosphooligosaccharide--protein glycosyltransferase
LGETFKERLGNSLSVFSRVGIQVSHGTIIAYAALILILFISFTVRMLPLRWENLAAGTAYLNEFDPYYQFSITKHMLDNGLLSPYYPTPWINTMKWYPDGLDMSTSLPALPMTAAVLYSIVSVFGANIDLMTFCSILPAFIAAVSCIVIYFIGKDMGGRTVGLFSALFFALAPSFLQRSSLGFFDTEVPGVLGLVVFILFFTRSLDSNRSLRASLLYSLGAGAALAYFISGWGAAYYIIGLACLFVFVLVLLKRYSQRMLINFSITFGLALMIGTKVPYIGLGYLVSGAILPVAAVFLVLIIAELLRNNISIKSKLTLTVASLVVIVGGFVTLWLTGALTSLAGKFITVIDPFIRASSPLIDSVAEQRISAWGNLYIELGISILFFLIGLYFTLRNPTNRNIFLLLFAVTSLYFATSMVRLLVLFAPAFAIIAAIGIMGTVKPFFTLLKDSSRTLAKSKRKMIRVSKEYSGIAVFVIFMLLVSNLAFSPQTPQTGGMPRSISQAFVPTSISSSSLPVGGSGLTQPVGAWLDAVEWLNNNVQSTDVVVMWWDYGNWLSDLGNVTSLADNTTVNSTQIANVGFVFMGNETQSLAMLSTYGQDRVKYIAVFTVLGIQSTGTGNSYIAFPSGYGDEGKWMWMARISGQEKQRFIDSGFISEADAWTDETSFGAQSTTTNLWEWNDRGLNCTVEKLMNYAEVIYATAITEQGTYSITPDITITPPTYFRMAYFAGLNTAPAQYGGLVPIIAIYEIDWAAYNAATGTQP